MEPLNDSYVDYLRHVQQRNNPTQPEAAPEPVTITLTRDELLHALTQTFNGIQPATILAQLKHRARPDDD